MRPAVGIVGLWLMFAGAGPYLAVAQGGERFEFTEALMGTLFRIVVYAPDGAAAVDGAGAAFAAVARLDSLLSDYRPDSEASRLSKHAGAGGGVAVSDELWAILLLSEQWAHRTGGAFDVTVGPLTRLWRWSARRGGLPGASRLTEARRAVGFEHLTMIHEAQAVHLERPGMALDFGGIAKGYAADAAMAELSRRGFNAAMVDAGGDLVLGAAPPGRPGWRVGLPGGGEVFLSGVAVATSGDRYRFLEVDGVRYSHVVDPRTGLGVPSAPTVTVVAGDGATADVLASALTVLDAAAGKALLASVPGADARVRGTDQWVSRTFPRPSSRSSKGAIR